MKYIKIWMAFCVDLSCFSMNSNSHYAYLVSITSIVHDDKGRPVSGALVSGNAGNTTATTDQSGRFSITVPANSVVLINAKGYKMQTWGAGAIPGRISLAAESGGQEVYLPFAFINTTEFAGTV